MKDVSPQGISTEVLSINCRYPCSHGLARNPTALSFLWHLYHVRRKKTSVARRRAIAGRPIWSNTSSVYFEVYIFRNLRLPARHPRRIIVPIWLASWSRSRSPSLLLTHASRHYSSKRSRRISTWQSARSTGSKAVRVTSSFSLLYGAIWRAIWASWKIPGG